MAAPRKWADLPKDLLYLVSTRLPPDLHYFVRLRAVCKSWHSSLPLSDPPPQLPWLLDYESTSLNQTLRFYSFASGETATIHVPERYRGMMCNGPGHGYLLVSSVDKQVLYLVNPLTDQDIFLPELNYEFLTQSPACSGLDPIRNWHIVSFRTDSDLWTWIPVIYHPDTNNWTYVDDNLHITCCCGGRLFATNVGDRTGVFNAISGEKLDEVPPPEDEDIDIMGIYLVESCGEILRVSWDLDIDGTEEVDDSIFCIYKLSSEGGERGRHRWVKVTDIGDQMVFLDLMNGFSMKAPSGFKGNCIYFLSDDDSTPCRYDIGTGTVERLPCPFICYTWFIPNLL